MIARLLIPLLALFLTLSARAADVPPDAAPPQMEVVFVLDTTGSMAGLLEGAKAKIWSIANEIMKSAPKPDLKIGLVAYRDKGDTYVVQVTDLTRDLDNVYGILLKLKADGGGDTPENVRQALHEALTKISWSKGKGVFKTVFLVGDAPPHMDYADVPTVEDLCLSAVKADVLINTVRCGGDGETGRIWQKIASSSEGTYLSIAQDGGVEAVPTPFDKELGDLSDRVGRTLVPFGAAEARDGLLRMETEAAGAPAPAKADRACFKAAEGGRLHDADLLDAIREGRTKLGDLKAGELPAEIRDKGPKEQKAWLDAKLKERGELQARILEVSKKRDEYLVQELAKRDRKDGFDDVVKETLRKQAAARGILLGK